jgi:hypothetical protein
LLLLVAPFERLRPLISLPGQKLTTVEAAIVVALGAWLATAIWFRERPRWLSPISVPWIAWLAVAGVAALVAPAFHVNAIKVVARLVIGGIVLLLPLNGITTTRRLATALVLAAASGVVVAIIARLEFSGAPAIVAWLHAFRENVRVVGGQIRASGTLQYPTIASMYLEIVFALTLGVLLWAVDRRSLVLTIVGFAALVMMAEGVIVTLTRSGLITLAISLALLGVWRYGRLGVDRGVVLLGALGAVIAALVIVSASAESFRLRFMTDGRSNWYRAGFLVPEHLSLARGSVTAIEATVINKGLVSWDPDARPPFHVSYHWFNDDYTRVVRYDGLRTPLRRRVRPGESLRVLVQVQVPKQDGQFLLGWDVVQEGRLWFSTEPGSRTALSSVTVSGEGSSEALNAASLRYIPEQAIYVGRPQLWRAALRIAAAHPLLGIGPDNYRLSYGPYAHIDRPDPRVTSNNMYLEILTGTGAIGLLAFVWILRRAQRTIRETRLALDGAAASLYAGVAAASVAVAVHGVLDSFLTLTPTYLTIALTLGLAMAPAAWTRTDATVDIPQPANSESIEAQHCA